MQFSQVNTSPKGTSISDVTVSTTAPASPYRGKYWIDTNTPLPDELKTWNGTAWVKITDLATYATFAGFPGVGVTGTVYYDQATGNLYAWNGTGYVPYGSVLPNTAGGGAGTVLHTSSGASSTNIDTGSLGSLTAYKFLEVLFSCSGGIPGSSSAGVRFNGLTNVYQDYTATTQFSAFSFGNATGQFGMRMTIENPSSGLSAYYGFGMGQRYADVQNSGGGSTRGNQGLYIAGSAISSIQVVSGNPMTTYSITVIGYA